MYSYRNVLKMIKEHNIGTAQNFDQTARRQFPQRNSTKRVSVLFRLSPMLRRQERHNEGALTALMSTESLVQQDGCDNHTHEGKPARAYNITQCRRHCLLAFAFMLCWVTAWFITILTRLFLVNKLKFP